MSDWIDERWGKCCVCNHGPDDMCLNRLVYVSCGSEFCGGACEDAGSCKYIPGCCDYDWDMRSTEE